MTIGEALVWIALIAAAVTCIVTGNGSYVIALVVIAFFLA